MTKEHAELNRQRAIAAVKEAQAALGRATSVSERAWLKQELESRQAELAEAKRALREINLAAIGAKPIEMPAAKPEPTIEELATTLLEAFQRLLVLDVNHEAIRALREHFISELPRRQVEPRVEHRRLPPKQPAPLKSKMRIPYLDGGTTRQVVGPGATLYCPARKGTTR